MHLCLKGHIESNPNQKAQVTLKLAQKETPPFSDQSS